MTTELYIKRHPLVPEIWMKINGEVVNPVKSVTAAGRKMATLILKKYPMMQRQYTNLLLVIADRIREDFTTHHVLWDDVIPPHPTLEDLWKEVYGNDVTIPTFHFFLCHVTIYDVFDSSTEKKVGTYRTIKSLLKYHPELKEEASKYVD